VRSAAALGFSGVEIVATLQRIRRVRFYISMTCYADHRVWQDVYHVPSKIGLLYVKFTADALTDFFVVIFQGKEWGLNLSARERALRCGEIFAL
jgi:motility quorum-sensing regulator/GCU-specific mRNA interferase toxin